MSRVLIGAAMAGASIIGAALATVAALKAPSDAANLFAFLGNFLGSFLGAVATIWAAVWVAQSGERKARRDELERQLRPARLLLDAVEAFATSSGSEAEHRYKAINVRWTALGQLDFTAYPVTVGDVFRAADEAVKAHGPDMSVSRRLETGQMSGDIDRISPAEAAAPVVQAIEQAFARCRRRQARFF